MAESLEAQFFNMSVQSFDIGSSFYARTTNILDPYNFYVFPLAFQNMLFEIQRPGGRYQQEDLKVHLVVVYYSHALNGFIRGRIQHISDDGRCHMYALDNGFMECNVNLNRIFHPVHNAARHTQGLVRLCELDLSVPISRRFSRDILDAFRHFIGHERLYVHVRGLKGEKLVVKLYNSYPEDVATLIAFTQNDAAGRALNSCDVSQVPEWTHHELDVGQILDVRVLNGCTVNDFYVCIRDDFTDYMNSRADFTFYCETQQQIPYTEFVRGQLVGVMDMQGEFFERAVIVDVIDVGYRAKVKLIDWGTEFITEINKVKLIRSRVYLDTPARAIYCSAPNAFTWNTGLPTFLYKGFKLTVTVERLGSGWDIPHIVSLSPARHN